MPYSTLAGFRRARRSETLQYKQLHFHDRDEKLYKEWQSVIGKKNMPKTLENFQEIRYNNSNKYKQLQDYKNSITSGKLSPLVDFELYKEERQKFEKELIGLETSNKIKIKGINQHFYERYFGSIEEKRNGVSFENIIECLSKGEPGEIKTGKTGKKSQTFIINGKGSVSVNPETKEIIQVNPYKK